jgi:maleate isomerase
MSSPAPHLVPAIQPAWQQMPFTADQGSPTKAAIGLITLSNDITIEPELSTFLPRDGVALYSNRIPFPAVNTVEALRSMEQNIRDTAALINPGERLDVVIFGCTSGTMTIGDDVVRARIKEAKPDVETTDPITAGITGLNRLGCKRIAVLTPYIDEVNEVVDRFITSKGMIIGARGSFKLESSAALCRVSPDSIYDAGMALGKADVDGLFISCTALRVSPIIERLEADLGKPVVASNQALAWHATRLAGCDETVEGYGQLLRI